MKVLKPDWTMIIKFLTDNDLYKFTTMNAIQKLYPGVMVRYSFINRGQTAFPEGFAGLLRKEVDSMAGFSLSTEEEKYLADRCYYFDPVFIDLLKGFRYDPGEVTILQEGSNLIIEIEGPWYRTVLWEVPLLALVSELYYLKKGLRPADLSRHAVGKAAAMNRIGADFSDFGTRRRFSFSVQDQVVSILKEKSPGRFRGTSNVYLAMKYNLTPVGTHPHEWFMFHATRYGYQSANTRALDAWVRVYRGDLGIALSDTFTSENFFASFSVFHAKLFDGIRHDSGDPLTFADKAIEFYRKNRIDPLTKTIVFSDGLDTEKVSKIKKYIRGRIKDAYGIGTNLTNDVGAEPLNIVIKLNAACQNKGMKYTPVIKLSDDPAKYTGDPEEIELCKRILGV